MKSMSSFKDLYFSIYTLKNGNHFFKDDYNIFHVYHAYSYLATEQRATIYAFVILPNHMQIIWNFHQPWSLEQNQKILLGYTSTKISGTVEINETEKQLSFENGFIWKRNAVSIQILTQREFIQKKNYLHRNPEYAGLTGRAIDYRHSSYQSYKSRKPQFDFLTLWDTEI